MDFQRRVKSLSAGFFLAPYLRFLASILPSPNP
jgi:hypothetical protein